MDKSWLLWQQQSQFQASIQYKLYQDSFNYTNYIQCHTELNDFYATQTQNFQQRNRSTLEQNVKETQNTSNENNTSDIDLSDIDFDYLESIAKQQNTTVNTSSANDYQPVSEEEQQQDTQQKKYSTDNYSIQSESDSEVTQPPKYNQVMNQEKQYFVGKQTNIKISKSFENLMRIELNNTNLQNSCSVMQQSRYNILQQERREFPSQLIQRSAYFKGENKSMQSNLQSQLTQNKNINQQDYRYSNTGFTQIHGACIQEQSYLRKRNFDEIDPGPQLLFNNSYTQAQQVMQQSISYGIPQYSQFQQFTRNVKQRSSYVQTNPFCTRCGTTISPAWRKGPAGPKTLCNACGVRYMKEFTKKDVMSKKIEAVVLHKQF